ncbi:hypothetical protein D3C76_826610 [compost metagenome]
MLSISLISTPKISSASGKLGVINVAKGNNSLIKVSLASSDNSLKPVFEIITGSNTITGSLSTFLKDSAIAFIDSIFETIPIFIASI